MIIQNNSILFSVIMFQQYACNIKGESKSGMTDNINTGHNQIVKDLWYYHYRYFQNTDSRPIVSVAKLCEWNEIRR